MLDHKRLVNLLCLLYTVRVESRPLEILLHDRRQAKLGN